MKKTISRRAAFKRAPVAAGCAMLIMAGASAYAQQLDPGSRAAGTQATLGTVTITGIQAAIESAISVKKGADTIVEAISSEDMGKLPDPSVADSIARLPGVSAQRNKDSGKAQSISVRGMSPDFNGALMNGREQASAGDSRGVDFDLFPGELLSGVLVYKTPHAGLVGQGLSSTIDLQTVRPLSYKTRAISFNARKLRSGIDNYSTDGKVLPEGSGDRQTLSYVDQFADRTIGIALGFAKFKDDGAVKLVTNSWDEDKTLKFNGKDVRVPGAVGYDNVQNKQKRDGAMGVLQFKPNANFETVVDFFYSKGESYLKKNGFEGPIVGGKGATADDITKEYRGISTLIAAQVDANGIATSGTINNYKPVIRNHTEGANDELKTIGWNTKLVTGDWTNRLDVGTSKVTRNSERYETYAGLPGNCNVQGFVCDTISWTGFTGGSNAAPGIQYKTGLNYSDPNVARLTDVLGWAGGPLKPQAGTLATIGMSDTVNSLRFSTRREVEFGPIGGLEVGINQTKREKANVAVEGFPIIKGGDPFGAAVAPGATASSVAGVPIMSWDPRGALGSVYDLRADVSNSVINRNWAVNEKVTTSFVKADLDGSILGFNYTGNIGTQVVNTDQYSTAFNSDAAGCSGTTVDTCKPVMQGTRFNDLLPSLNLAFNVASDQVVRVGVGRVMSRPKMGDMRANLEVGWDKTKEVFQDAAGNPISGVYSGSGGNPTLQPFRANAYDVSYERYFGKKGYVSVAAFYKDLQTYILNAGRLVDFSGKLSANALAAAPVGASTLGILTSPFNGSGGNIKGMELAVSIPLSLASSYLEGFGIAVNHSNTDSSITFNPSTVPNADPGISRSINIPLPGLSRQVTNSRFFYERFGLQIAIANRKRTDFIGDIADYKDDRKITFIAGDSVTDLQVGYEFDYGYLKGLSVQFQAQNVNNSPFITYTDPSKPQISTYGKTYLFGLNYKY